MRMILFSDHVFGVNNVRYGKYLDQHYFCWMKVEENEKMSRESLKNFINVYEK